jgi:hypothetical protein
MASFEEQYFDVLKSIETAIVATYANQSTAKDRHADAALNSLARYYNAAIKGKRPPRIKLSEIEQSFYDAIKAALEAHMSSNGLEEDGRSYTVEETVQCIKRIQRSISQMMKVGGLGGTKYLEFVRDYQNRTGQ